MLGASAPDGRTTQRTTSPRVPTVRPPPLMMTVPIGTNGAKLSTAAPVHQKATRSSEQLQRMYLMMKAITLLTALFLPQPGRNFQTTPPIPPPRQPMTAFLT